MPRPSQRSAPLAMVIRSTPYEVQHFVHPRVDTKKDCPPLHKKCIDAIKLLEPPTTSTGGPKASGSILLKPETLDATPPAQNDKNDGGSMIPTPKPTK